MKKGNLKRSGDWINKINSLIKQKGKTKLTPERWREIKEQKEKIEFKKKKSI